MDEGARTFFSNSRLFSIFSERQEEFSPKDKKNFLRKTRIIFSKDEKNISLCGVLDEGGREGGHLASQKLHLHQHTHGAHARTYMMT